MSNPSQVSRVVNNHQSGPRSKPKVNAMWTIALFGTAVGAGILFLPIKAGSFGFWPLVVATLLIGPMTFLAHQAYERMVGFSPTHGENILEVLREYFGSKPGLLLAVIYWFTIFPVVLIYGVSIVNTAESFIVNQLHGPELSRWVLAPVLVGLMTAGLAFGRKIMLALSQLVVYPLIIALIAVSIYLVPRWDFGSFMEAGDSSATGILSAVILILPVLVFSFSYVAALSQFSLGMEHEYGEYHQKQSSRVILGATALLTVFTMFFVWSCALALGADGMRTAKENNLPVLSYFANVTGTPFMAYIAPIIVICAIASSYFGHALGAVEGTQYLLKAVAPGFVGSRSARGIELLIYLFIFVCTTLVGVYNPSILDMISVVGGIFFAFMTYLLPMLAIHKVEALKQFRGQRTNYFVAAIGVVVLGATIWGMFL